MDTTGLYSLFHDFFVALKSVKSIKYDIAKLQRKVTPIQGFLASTSNSTCLALLGILQYNRVC